MKNLFMVVISLFLFSCSSMYEIDKTPDSYQERILKVSSNLEMLTVNVIIERFLPNEKVLNQYGTGILLNENIVLTCAHAIAKDYSVIVVGNKFYQSKTKLIFIDRKNDIAVLKMDKPQSKYFYFELSNDTPNTGTVILSYGYGLLMPTLKNGLVSNTDLINYYLLHINIATGDSGSPVVDLYGNVVCMVTKYFGYDFKNEDKPVPVGIGGCVSSKLIFSKIKHLLK